MSINTIERIFWEFNADKSRVDQFLQNPEKYLDYYPLTEEERQMVLTMNVEAMDAYGVSSMLTLPTFNMLTGGSPLQMFEFLRRLNDGKMINRMKLPAWQFAMLRLAITTKNTWGKLMSSLGLKKSIG